MTAVPRVARLRALATLLVLGALPAPCRAANEIRHAGDALQIVIPAGALGLSLHRHDGQGSRELLESVALTTAITVGLKLGVHEERPSGGMHSFPSGHTALAFCGAEYLQHRYGPRWGVPALVLATFVGYSRVESKEHWTHDVVAGAAIGVAGARALTRSGWTVAPSVASGTLAIGLAGVF